MLPPIGSRAPEVTLPSLDGRIRTLPPPGATGATLAVFFKVTCPTCRLILPFLARLHARYASPEVGFLGVSQDGAGETVELVATAGTGFPVMLDGEADGFPASNAYGLVTVPSLLLLDREGAVAFTTTGFVKKELKALAAMLASSTGRSAEPLWEPHEQIPERRPG